jgi:hypothetical protein
LDQHYERQQRAGADAFSRAARWRRHYNIQSPDPAHPLPPRAEANALPPHASYQNGQSHFQIVAPQQIPTASVFCRNTSYILPSHDNDENAIPNAACATRNAIACSECGANRHRSSSTCVIYRYYQYSRHTNIEITRRRGESAIKAAERTWREMTEIQQQAFIHSLS